MVILIALLTSCGSDEDDEQTVPDATPPNPLTLLSNLNTPGLQSTDVWGYVDPNSNKEYALIGRHVGRGCRKSRKSALSSDSGGTERGI